MSKNTKTLIINLKSGIKKMTAEQAEAVNQHTKKYGVTAYRTNCTESDPAFTFVECARQRPEPIFQNTQKTAVEPAAPAPVTAAKSKMVEFTFANGNKCSIDSSAFGF